QVGDDRFHEVGPHALSRALLHVVQLAHGVARRPSGDSGYGSETFQISTMADAALRRLAASAGRRERFALLDAANRHVGGESRVRIAEVLRALRVVWSLDNALTDRLSILSLELQEHTAGDPRFRNGVRFDHLDPGRPFHGAEIAGRRLGFLV